MILHRDARWLAVDKPTGLPTHAPRAGVLGVVEWLRLHLGIEAHVVSRLDTGTSGVLLMALTAGAAAEAQRVHESGGARKTYLLLTAAVGGPETCERTDDLDGRSCRTVFTRVGVRTVGGQPLTAYRAELSRGRRHQVRRHAAAAGIPVAGDDEHGGAPWPRLCLHCVEVVWPGLAASLRAPEPASFTVAAATDLGLALCRDRRGDWLAPITDARRLVHRDEIPGLPAAVDRFGEWFNATWFDEDSPDEAAGAALAPVLDGLEGCRGGVIRVHRRNPHRRDLVAGKILVGEPPPETFTVSEHGLRYEINLTGTQHAGLFLDQRDTRRRLALAARGARLANLFAYTCSFAVVAAAAGAEVAFSVDTAKACLETGKANFARNGLTEKGVGKFVREDVRRWLARQERRRTERPDEHRHLDLVVCDPPVFASARDGGKFAVEREWPRLARAVAALLGPEGQALFANNHRQGNHARYRQQLAEHFGQVEDLRPPLDFPELPGQPPQVRIFWCRPGGPA